MISGRIIGLKRVQIVGNRCRHQAGYSEEQDSLSIPEICEPRCCIIHEHEIVELRGASPLSPRTIDSLRPRPQPCIVQPVVIQTDRLLSILSRIHSRGVTLSWLGT